MARDRKIPSDFWTWEAVIDCAPMTRLLFIGLWNFADDHGVQPLRPRTIRLQVFPGDAIDSDAVRAMIDELVSRGLVRIFEADGTAYLSVIDWEQIQRVGRGARRRYPADPAKPASAPAVPALPSSPTAMPAASDPGRVPSRWRKQIGRRLRRIWPGGPPADTEKWIMRWHAEGHDLERDVLPAISEACRPAADRDPPADLSVVAAMIEVGVASTSRPPSPDAALAAA